MDRVQISPLDTNEVPRQGIQLSFLCALLDNLNFPEAEKPNITTAEVCSLQPLTGKDKCSFCDYLKSLDPSVVGDSKVFISHAWHYKFVEVIEASEDCFVSYNQHQSTGRSFDWWSTTFKNAIEAIGRTVMVLAP